MILPDSPAHSEKALTAKQMHAALSLAQGKSINMTAGEVGCHESTIDNWKKIPAFREAIEQVEAELYEESLKLLKRSSRAAIMTLLACMNEKCSSYVRVQAASKILDLGIELYKVRQLEQEVGELRRLVMAKDDDDWQA